MMRDQFNSSVIEEIQMGQGVHYFLTNLGDAFRIKARVDCSQIIKELEAFESHWRPYNIERPFNRREGMAVSSLDGSMLNEAQLEPISEFNQKNGTTLCDLDFNTPTEIAKNLLSLFHLLNLFPLLGRTNLIRLKAGGFFPPHRDLDSRTFRILVPILNCDPEYFFFQVGSRRVFLEHGWPYVINIRAVHSVFSFKDDATFLLMNVPSNWANANTVTSLLAP